MQTAGQAKLLMANDIFTFFLSVASELERVEVDMETVAEPPISVVNGMLNKGAEQQPERTDQEVLREATKLKVQRCSSP